MKQDPFAQVRQAHRICGAYYQQILPMINEAAQKSGTSFLLWEVWSFNKPPNKRTNPLETWKWNYLPMLNVSFVFSKQQQANTAMTPGDYVLDFKLVTDSELEYHQRELQYGAEEPVATTLAISAEEAKSYLNVSLFSPVNNDDSYASPEDMWESYAGYPQTDSAIYFSDNKQIKGIAFNVPLTDIANDNCVNWLVDSIAEHRKRLLES